MKPIWIVDDDQSIRFVLEKALSRESLATRSFTNPREVLNALEDEAEPPQVLVSDIRMPGGSGLDLLGQVKQRLPGLPVIIMTAFSDLDSAVSAFQGGAFEYLPKPFDIPKAVELIHRAVAESQREEVAAEQQTVAPEMLGQAPAMQDVFRAIGRLSQSNVTVLITGESGSGKELVARALHKHSPRAGGPFVAINTAAIPKDLLESELFGHERGAFTGAQTMRRGRFEQADGGTLFLDEIGDMPFDLQTRLLRVLSDGQFYRVGGHSAVKTNARVIAATHQNLEQRVKDGSFREDLFHRLNVIRLRLPPLRERRADVPALARHFLQQSARQLGVEPKRFADAALARLAGFDFPGNVRQLENSVVVREKTGQIAGAANTEEALKDLSDMGIPIMPFGNIGGLSGTLMTRSKIKGIPASCLFAEVLNQYPDPRAAAAMVDTLNRKLGTNINPEPLLKEAEEIEARLKELANTVQDGQESPAYS